MPLSHGIPRVDKSTVICTLVNVVFIIVSDLVTMCKWLVNFFVLSIMIFADGK